MQNQFTILRTRNNYTRYLAYRKITTNITVKIATHITTNINYHKQYRKVYLTNSCPLFSRTFQMSLDTLVMIPMLNTT